jgi:signal transduction histidine kinase
VRTDKDLLMRILDNLISNAIKFSPFNKTITLTLSRNEGHVVFIIQDEGPGIRPQDRAMLFHKFKKLSARPTDGESSSGLGLSIVKDLVDMLKGSIDVRSEVGKGACFIVKLPYQSR